MTRWWDLDSAGKGGFGKVRQGHTGSWGAGHTRITKETWLRHGTNPEKTQGPRVHGEKGSKLSIHRESRS